MTETKITGRKFRRVTDAANKIYERISFWTKASDVEFDDNTTAESKVGSVKGITSDISAVTTSGYAADALAVKTIVNDEIGTAISNMQTNFQAGVDTLYNKCVSLGVTPTAKTPTAIATAIDTIYSDRYTAGMSDLKSTTSVYCYLNSHHTDTGENWPYSATSSAGTSSVSVSGDYGNSASAKIIWGS